MALPGAQALSVHVLSSPAPFTAALLRYPHLPAPGPVCLELGAVLLQWLETAARRRRLRPAIFLQGTALHTAELVNRLTDHGAEWIPDLGLAMRPGAPPRLLAKCDLDALRWDEFPRPGHETLFHLMDEGAFRAAVPAYTGTAALMCCLLTESVEAFLMQQRALWLPTIAEPAFRAHSFYVASFAPDDWQRAPAELASWMVGMGLYVREISDEGGLVAVSTEPKDIEDLHSAVETCRNR